MATVINEFLKEPPKTASGKALTGRIVCNDIQWTGNGPDLVGTFTITARELLAYADSNLLWTDQDVQRGIKPEVAGARRELSLAAGYPDSNTYIFDADRTDEIVEKLLDGGEKLFLNPLIWNLRPGEFEGFYDKPEATFHIYSGKVFLPDSHHRHQAIIKAAKAVQESPKTYPLFNLDKQFKVELYFLSKEDEGNYFYAKNQLPRPTAKSKAFDLSSQDDLSILAKRFVSKSTALSDNVNRVTDRLTSKNAQVTTLSTVREMMKTLASSNLMDSSEIEGLSTIAASFFDMIADVRTELRKISIEERVQVRKYLLVDSGVMMHGYAALMRSFQTDISRNGSSRAELIWKEKLSRLSADHHFRFGAWNGDLFEKTNPLWQKVGITKPNSSQTGVSVVSNGATRAMAGRVLNFVTASPSDDLSVLQV